MNSGLGTKDFRNSFIEYLGHGPSIIKGKINWAAYGYPRSMYRPTNTHTNRRTSSVSGKWENRHWRMIFAMKAVVAVHKVGSQWLLRP